MWARDRRLYNLYKRDKGKFKLILRARTKFDICEKLHIQPQSWDGCVIRSKSVKAITVDEHGNEISPCTNCPKIDACDHTKCKNMRDWCKRVLAWNGMRKHPRPKKKQDTELRAKQIRWAHEIEKMNKFVEK